MGLRFDDRPKLGSLAKLDSGCIQEKDAKKSHDARFPPTASTFVATLAMCQAKPSDVRKGTSSHVFESSFLHLMWLCMIRTYTCRVVSCETAIKRVSAAACAGQCVLLADETGTGIIAEKLLRVWGNSKVLSRFFFAGWAGLAGLGLGWAGLGWGLAGLGGLGWLGCRTVQRISAKQFGLAQAGPQGWARCQTPEHYASCMHFRCTLCAARKFIK